jgi:hypothetical protein
VQTAEGAVVSWFSDKIIGMISLSHAFLTLFEFHCGFFRTFGWSIMNFEVLELFYFLVFFFFFARSSFGSLEFFLFCHFPFYICNYVCDMPMIRAGTFQVASVNYRSFVV